MQLHGQIKEAASEIIQLSTKITILIPNYSCIISNTCTFIDNYILVTWILWTVIKMSSSKSRPRKVELMCICKNATTTMSILHKAMDLVNTLTNNLTALIYSLVNGLCKITTESIKPVLDVEQFGTSSNSIVPILTYRKCHLFLNILIKILHGFQKCL